MGRDFRKIIVENNLLDFLEECALSERNSDVILEYLQGSTFAEINRKYEKSHSWSRAIVYQFISRCSKRTGSRFLE